MRVEVAGTLGMVEDGALVGIPSVFVELVWDLDVAEQSTELVNGQLGRIAVPLP
jgi:hypothetical protein